MSGSPLVRHVQSVSDVSQSSRLQAQQYSHATVQPQCSHVTIFTKPDVEAGGRRGVGASAYNEWMDTCGL